MSVELSDLHQARERIRSVVLETPTLPSTSFSRLAGGDVLLEAENLQRTGSFKIRGTLNAIAQLSPALKEKGVVAASAGNHAQGVALAARELGIRSTVFMPYEPGHLAQVLAQVGSLGGNVLSVEHHREGTGQQFGTVRIQLAIETRSQAHIDEILEALDGYQIG